MFSEWIYIRHAYTTDGRMEGYIVPIIEYPVDFSWRKISEIRKIFLNDPLIPADAEKNEQYEKR